MPGPGPSTALPRASREVAPLRMTSVPAPSTQHPAPSTYLLLMSALHDLALALGILPSYFDVHGNVRPTSDSTRVALLSAMGFDVSSDENARESLERLRNEERSRILEPVAVAEIGTEASQQLVVQLPEATASRVRWQLEVIEESGVVHHTEGELPQGTSWRMTLPLPRLMTGYHDVRLALLGSGISTSAVQKFIVVPGHCFPHTDVVGTQGAFGLVANLYGTKRDGDWGVGDLRTLAMLLDWSADVGGSFVGVNPLHAIRNRGTEVSPYSPISRLFRNPLYIDVASVPEWSMALVREQCENPADSALIEAMCDARQIDYARAWAVKRACLERLHRAFRDHADEAQRETYATWRASREPALTEFATFCALQDEHIADTDWRSWPREHRNSQSDVVRRWRDEHHDEVDFHRWMQWTMDRQLAEAQAHGRSRGLSIGLYQDLAIGTNGGGSDAWSFGDLFVQGVNIGAPPDPYSESGQDWGLPPINPRRLRERAYDYWIQLLRGAFANAGALRIDHVMGLFRLFWIPWGRSGTEGAYIRYPSDELLGILALESQRHRAIVVGEDLGTVPPEVPIALEKWGILSSSVMMFMRTDDGGFRPGKEYPSRALATATTHDMAPLEGFWSGSDIALRVQLGLSPAEDEDQLRSERQREKRHLLARLRDEGVGDASSERLEDGGVALRAAVHAFVSRTPAALVGFSLDDLAGEDEPVNVPGVGPDRFPSWTKRMRMSVEGMRESSAVEAALRTEGRALSADGSRLSANR
jgi:4-alpha-glucanotransferase